MPPTPPASDTNRWFVEEGHPHDASLKAYLKRVDAEVLHGYGKAQKED